MCIDVTRFHIPMEDERTIPHPDMKICTATYPVLSECPLEFEGGHRHVIRLLLGCLLVDYRFFDVVKYSTFGNLLTALSAK